MLLVGVLLILAAMGVLAGSQFSRWFGIFAAGLGVIGHFSAMNMYPFWSLVVITCCILVIYGLAAYGGNPPPPDARSSGEPCRSRVRGSPSFPGARSL